MRADLAKQFAINVAGDTSIDIALRAKVVEATASLAASHGAIPQQERLAELIRQYGLRRHWPIATQEPAQTPSYTVTQTLPAWNLLQDLTQPGPFCLHVLHTYTGNDGNSHIMTRPQVVIGPHARQQSCVAMTREALITAVKQSILGSTPIVYWSHQGEIHFVRHIEIRATPEGVTTVVITDNMEITLS